MLPAAPFALPSELGRHRLVRILTRDECAVAALVHGARGARIARVFALEADPSAVEAELAVHDVLLSAPAPLRQHVVGLDDLFTLEDGRVVILLEPLTGGALHDLLDRGAGTLEPGEAVTILAPLIEAVAIGHELGLVGLPLRPQSVRFSPAGAPVIATVTGARVTPVLPAHYRSSEPLYRRDAAALRELGRAVARSLPPGGAAALDEAMGALEGESVTRDSALAVFDLAPPVAIRLDELGSLDRTSAGALPPPGREDHPGLDVDLSARAAGVEEAPPTPPASGEGAPCARAVAAIAHALRAVAIPEAVAAPVLRTLGALAARADAWRTRVSSRRADLPRVRPRALVAGAAGAAALVLAIALSLGSSEKHEGAASGTAANPATPDASALPPRAPGVSTTFDAPERLLHPTAEEWPEVVRALVGRWNTCRTESVSAAGRDDPVGTSLESCAAGVAHEGSLAAQLLLAEDDRHALLARWEASAGESVVIDRMGGVVLVDLVAAPSAESISGATTTASLLLIRSEAGWRVRDVRG